MAKNKPKWYVVWVGTEPGICETWEECKLRTYGYPGSRYKAFKSREEAIMAYRGDPDYDLLRAIAHAPTKRSVDFSTIPEIVPGSIAVDAACSGNPGVMEYRGVDVHTGVQLFHDGPYPEGTNNIGEFLAIVYAMAMLCKQGNRNAVIFSDSITALAWVRKGMCNTKLQSNERNEKLMQIVRRAEAWLRTYGITHSLRKWNTALWGEIPADFGRK